MVVRSFNKAYVVRVQRAIPSTVTVAGPVSARRHLATVPGLPRPAGRSVSGHRHTPWPVGLGGGGAEPAAPDASCARPGLYQTWFRRVSTTTEGRRPDTRARVVGVKQEARRPGSEEGRGRFERRRGPEISRLEPRAGEGLVLRFSDVLGGRRG